jgi:hypothetical protein
MATSIRAGPGRARFTSGNDNIATFTGVGSATSTITSSSSKHRQIATGSIGPSYTSRQQNFPANTHTSSIYYQRYVSR